MDQSSFNGLSRIGQIAITVRDLDRAASYYSEVLGMTQTMRFPTLAFFDAGGVRLMLGVAEDEKFNHPGSIIYYVVDDIDEAHNTLADRGANFVSEPHLIAKLPDREVWMAFIEDPEGNTIGLMNEKPTAPDQ